MMKKILITAGIFGIIAIALILGNSEKFFGKLVFFESAPVKEKVIQGSYLTVKDAFVLLMDAGIKSGKTSKEKIQEVAKEFDSISEFQITRGQFADMAAKLFSMENYGYGVNFSDVGSKDKFSKSIYLFTSNGGIDAEFKPENPATRTFGEKAAANLIKRFSK